MTELELIEGCKREDSTCQRLLFEQHAGKMMTICLRYALDSMEAEDMLQEAMIRVFSYIHQFKFEGSFEGWIRRIVVNTALKYVQKRRIRFVEVTDRAEQAPRMDADAYSSLGEADIMRLIQQLPDGYRIVFNLNVLEGFSHEEIGKMLNIHPGTSRSQLVKARKMLQNQILQLQKIAI